MRILITFTMLVICAVSDIRTGYVNVKVVAVATGMWILLSALGNIYISGSIKYDSRNINNDIRDISVLLVLSQILMIMVLLFLIEKYGHIIDRLIGTGDIYIFVSVGIINGMAVLLATTIVSFTISGAYALFLCLVKKRDGKSGFALVPFILAGYIYVIIRNISSIFIW